MHRESMPVLAHGQSVPRISAGARPVIAAELAGLVAGESLSAFCLGRGRSAGFECDRVGVREGRARTASLSSADDDQDSAVWLLCRGIFLASDAEEIGGRCGLPDAGGRE